jgi:Family of unknown function (DUF6152)
MSRAIKNQIPAVLFLTAGLINVSTPMFGHHGTGVAYDSEKPTEVKGTVTEFKWQNPHAQLFIDAKSADGTVEHWAVEMNSPGVMTRQGWTRHQFKAGDEVTITVFPAKSGALVGSCIGRCKVIINGTDATPKPTPGPGGGEQF